MFAETALVEEEDSALTMHRWNAFVKEWEQMFTEMTFAEQNEFVPR